jgi:transcription antitermination factor NusG
MNTAQAWFALQVAPRNEKKIINLLRQKGYECFTPTYWQKRKWSDRTVDIELPLFPTYVFCYFSPSTIGKVIATQGVIRIVGFGGKPAEIAVEEVEALQLLAQSYFLREPWNYLTDGTIVLIETGPLAGVRGTICQNDNKRRLVISVTLLRRSVAIQLDEGTVVTTVPCMNRNKISLSAESEIASVILRGT